MEELTVLNNRKSTAENSYPCTFIRLNKLNPDVTNACNALGELVEGLPFFSSLRGEQFLTSLKIHGAIHANLRIAHGLFAKSLGLYLAPSGTTGVLPQTNSPQAYQHGVPTTGLANWQDVANSTPPAPFPKAKRGALDDLLTEFWQGSTLTQNDQPPAPLELPVSKTTPPFLVSDSGNVRRLLGDEGWQLMTKIIALIQETAQREGWPLEDVEVRHERDAEFHDWEYVLTILRFNASFETADQHLNELYVHLDEMARHLDDERQSLLRRLIFFDVDVTNSLSSV